MSEKMAKFTPGPWEFGKERRWLFRDNLKADGNFSSTRILKIDADAFRPSDADARLIAAAPEMFEAARPFALKGWVEHQTLRPSASDCLQIEIRIVGTSFETTVTVGEVKALCAALSKAGEAR